MTEGHALNILNEYCNADLSSVRNRAAYLIGIIKKLGKGPPPRLDAPLLPREDFLRDNSFKRPRYEDPRQLYGPGPAVLVRPPAMYGPGALREPPVRVLIDAEIDRHVRAGAIAYDDIDESTRDYLSAQSFSVAARAISEFCCKDMKKVQNKGSFLKGIARKINEREFPQQFS